MNVFTAHDLFNIAKYFNGSLHFLQVRENGQFSGARLQRESKKISCALIVSIIISQAYRMYSEWNDIVLLSRFPITVILWQDHEPHIRHFEGHESRTRRDMRSDTCNSQQQSLKDLFNLLNGSLTGTRTSWAQRQDMSFDKHESKARTYRVSKKKLLTELF